MTRSLYEKYQKSTSLETQHNYVPPDALNPSLNSERHKRLGGPWQRGMEWVRGHFWTFCVLAFLVVCLVGFGSSVAAIHRQGTAYSSLSVECPTLPNVTTLSAERNFGWTDVVWHRTYGFQETSGVIRQMCPSMQHDVDLYLGDELVSRSDKKIISIVSLTHIRDCHGQTVFDMRTGNAWETVVNGNRIMVTFLLTPPDSDQPLAYVEGTHFWSDTFTIQDSNGQPVAQVKRTLPDFLSWTLTRYQPDHVGADWRVLSTLAGYQSFGSHDSCNGYFWVVGFLVLASVVAALLCLLWLFRQGMVRCFRAVHNGCQQCRSQRQTVDILRDIPTAGRNHGIYDILKLWEITANTPTQQMSIQTLASNLDKECWTIPTPTGETYVTPRQVLANPARAPEHHHSIQVADLTYPILVYQDHGEYDILDGLHRLSKAVSLHHETIQVKILTDVMLDHARIGK